MQQYFTYGRKRRKVQDVLDAHLPVTVLRMDAERRKKTVIAIPIAIKTMPALLLCRHYFLKIYCICEGTEQIRIVWNTSLSFCWEVYFLSYRKLRLLYDKSLRQDAHSREDVICRRRPRSARKCAKRILF